MYIFNIVPIGIASVELFCTVKAIAYKLIMIMIVTAFNINIILTRFPIPKLEEK